MDAMSSAKFLVKPDVKASAHVVIGRDGQVIQMVPFNIEAWHAGRSSYGEASGLNHYSVGIELDNLGQLRQEGGKFVAECGKEVPVKGGVHGRFGERSRRTGMTTRIGRCGC